jgi:hypothetical protein
MKISTRSVAAASATVAVLGLGAPPALAAAPPKGKYVCTYFTGSYNAFSGNLNILSSTTYRVNSGKKGRYTRSGSRLRFTTGDYRRLYTARYERSGGQDVIHLLQKNGREGPVCTREK